MSVFITYPLLNYQAIIKGEINKKSIAQVDEKLNNLLGIFIINEAILSA